MLRCLVGGTPSKHLLEHPSFWAGHADDLGGNLSPTSLPEAPPKLLAEAQVFASLAACATPFITPIDESSVSLAALPAGSVASSQGTTGQELVRLRARSETAGFGWRDTRADFQASMARESRQERLVGRGQPAAEQKRVQARLLLARLDAPSFKGHGGGNALFEALSLAMWGTPAYHLILRQLAVQYMQENPEEYRCFLGDDWQYYLSAMAQPGTPGDELTLRAVGDHLGCSISIVTPDPFMWLLRYAPRRTKTLREVFVAFAGPGTWVPIRRQSAMTSLKISLGTSSEYKTLRRALQQQAQAQALQQQRGQLPHGGRGLL